MSIKSKVFAAAATLTLVGGVGSVRVLWYAATPALPAGRAGVAVMSEVGVGVGMFRR